VVARYAARFPYDPKNCAIRATGRLFADSQELQLPGKTIVPSALSDHSGEEPFYVSGPRWFAASLYQRAETFCTQTEQQEIRVPVTTLDEVLEREGIEFVDFAKFDIEGAELSAFRGATRTFSRGGIAALSLEFGSGNINSRTFFRDFWDFLTDYGFDIFRVLPGGKCFASTSITKTSSISEAFRTIFAKRNSKIITLRCNPSRIRLTPHKT